MSPSEFDLRAALHEGEGDAPDALIVIADALRARRERRRRITSAAAAAVVVAAVGLGGTLVVRHAGSDESAGANANPEHAYSGTAAGGQYQGPAQLSPVAPATPSSTASSASERASASPAPCPARFPQQALPGGGGTGQFGADGPLFAAPVAAMQVCEYGAGAGRIDIIDPSAAQRFATVINQARGTQNAQLCLSGGRRYALYATTASGISLRVVTAEPGCHQYHVTNGTAERWMPTDELISLGQDPSPNAGSPDK